MSPSPWTIPPNPINLPPDPSPDPLTDLSQVWDVVRGWINTGAGGDVVVIQSLSSLIAQSIS